MYTPQISYDLTAREFDIARASILSVASISPSLCLWAAAQLEDLRIARGRSEARAAREVAAASGGTEVQS